MVGTHVPTLAEPGPVALPGEKAERARAAEMLYLLATVLPDNGNR
jgi:hypothetical protein